MVSCTIASNSTAAAQDTGILVIGGWYPTADQSVEFWSPTENCVLEDYPREMDKPTVNLVSNRLVACYQDTCEIYRDGSWQHLRDTTVYREGHSSATTKDAVLLIGGQDWMGYTILSTEWIPVDGSPARPGPFTVRHGYQHCTIQTSDDVIVVTGGGTFDFVTQYHLTDGTETPLTSLGQGRKNHACGVYQDTNGLQVLLVTGGETYDQRFSSTEVAIFTDGSQPLEWRETGQLPTVRWGLRAAVVDNVLYVTGGLEGDDDGIVLTSILAWDPVSETWQQAGELAVKRAYHAAIAVPSSILSTECSERL